MFIFLNFSYKYKYVYNFSKKMAKYINFICHNKTHHYHYHFHSPF